MDKNLIVIEENISCSPETYDKITNNIVNGNFFNILQSMNSDIIPHFAKSADGKITLFIKNLLDEDDTELGIISFTQEFQLNDRSEILVSGTQNDDFESVLSLFENIDQDNTKRIFFDGFTLNINKDVLLFKIRYDNTKHPSYIGRMIEMYFKKIFVRFSQALSNPHFL
jgi:hypothetical protein